MLRLAARNVECADMFDKLFWRQGAGRPQDARGQAQAIEVLHALDVAIKAVHPDRYRDLRGSDSR